jgi:hypothetical protein
MVRRYRSSTSGPLNAGISNDAEDILRIPGTLTS